MIRLIFVLLIGVASCGEGNQVPDAQPQQDSGSGAGSWTLNGTIRGISLQGDVRSAVAHKVDDGTSVRTAVTLVNLDGYCALSDANPSCPGQGTPRRQLEVIIRGTQPGTYPVTTGSHVDPPNGQSGVFFHALGDNCQLLTSPLEADSGTVTFSNINLASGGAVSFTFNVSTSEGPVSGTVTAPYCP